MRLHLPSQSRFTSSSELRFSNGTPPKGSERDDVAQDQAESAFDRCVVAALTRPAPRRGIALALLCDPFHRLQIEYCHHVHLLSRCRPVVRQEDSRNAASQPAQRVRGRWGRGASSHCLRPWSGRSPGLCGSLSSGHPSSRWAAPSPEDRAPPCLSPPPWAQYEVVVSHRHVR